MVNGHKVTDKELAAYANSWEADSLAVISKSQITVQRSILNLIAQQEATGATLASPCSTLQLTAVVPLPDTDGKKVYMKLRGQTMGPMRFPEDWRVEACGKRHSWIVYEDWYKPGEPTAVYAETGTGDWINPGPAEIVSK
jgi:hypothetical protein